MVRGSLVYAMAFHPGAADTLGPVRPKAHYIHVNTAAVQGVSCAVEKENLPMYRTVKSHGSPV